MMSSPGIRYIKKVFAFYYHDQMVFRLGKQFKPESVKLKSYTLLNPFKNKPPMSGWFQVPFSQKQLWEKLSYLALENIKQEIDV